jgi:hypothetical protein
MKKSGWFVYSVAVWLLAVIAAVFSCFTGMHNAYVWVLFLIMPEWFMVIHTGNRDQLSQYEIISACPQNIKRIFLCCVVYGAINFSLGMFLLRNGGPKIHEGVYCLWNHGFIREITESEYKSLLRTEGRMFTGNFLIFATVAMAYFAARERIHQLEKSGVK